jgi:hypothetical protein
MFLHMRDGSTARIKEGGEIDVESPNPVFVTGFEDVTASDDPGIVDEDVKPPCRFDGVVDELLALRLRSKISRFCPQTVAVLVYTVAVLVYLVDHSFQSGGICVPRDHDEAALDEPFGDGYPDAAGGAGNQRRFPIRLHVPSSIAIQLSDPPFFSFDRLKGQVAANAKVSPPS